MGAAQPPKPGHLVFCLATIKILRRMEDGARMGLHRDAVTGAQNMEIKRRHQRRHGGTGGLMSADLQPVPAFAQGIGIVDHPTRQPEEPFFEGVEREGGRGKAGVVRASVVHELVSLRFI